MPDNPTTLANLYKTPVTDWIGVAHGVTGRSPLAHVGFDELAQMISCDAPMQRCAYRMRALNTDYLWRADHAHLGTRSVQDWYWTL